MLTINVKSYSEQDDTFAVHMIDSLNGAGFDSTLPATMMPYIAPDVCIECEDLPYDLVGVSFTMKSHLVDGA